MASAKIVKKAGKKAVAKEAVAKKEQTGKKAVAKQQKTGPSLKDQVVEIQTVLKSVKTPSTDLLVKVAELLKQPARSEVEAKLLEAVQHWFHGHQWELQSKSQTCCQDLERLSMEVDQLVQEAQAANEALTQANAELLHAAVELPKREQELKAATSELEKAKKQGQAALKVVDTWTKHVADRENARELLAGLDRNHEGENPHKTKQWKNALGEIAKTAKASGCDQNLNDTACKVLATGLPFSAFARTVITSLGEFLAQSVTVAADARDTAQHELDSHHAVLPNVEAVHQDAAASLLRAQELKAQCEATLKAAKKEHKARMAQTEAHKQKLGAAQKEHAGAQNVKEQCEAAAATFDKLYAPMDEGCDADVEIVGESNVENEPVQYDEVPY